MPVMPGSLWILGNWADGIPQAASRLPLMRSWVMVSGFW